MDITICYKLELKTILSGMLQLILKIWKPSVGYSSNAIAIEFL